LQILDGHARTSLAPDSEIPVLVLDLNDEEADKLLATLDPLAAMAEANQQALDDLLGSITTKSEALRAMLDGLPSGDPPVYGTFPESRPIDGVDLRPYLTGEKTRRPHDVRFWRMSRRAALRSGDWKLVRNNPRPSDSAWQLYNLASDVSETRDLASSQPEKLEELQQTWERLNSEMLAPAWSPGR
jgi:hypothetical protein